MWGLRRENDARAFSGERPVVNASSLGEELGSAKSPDSSLFRPPNDGMTADAQLGGNLLVRQFGVFHDEAGDE